MGFDGAEVVRHRFLDGKLGIWQPKAGYRAGADPVFLAAAVAAKPGQSVLELGCGVGVASLCLGWRVRGLTMTGIEVQQDYADLARRNAAENDIDLQVETADLCQLPDSVRRKNFDHVFANPPYFLRAGGSGSDNVGRETARAEQTPLGVWIDVAVRRLKAGGTLTLIQNADRLPDLLAAFDARLGGVAVKPLVSRKGRDAKLVIVAARKGGRGHFRLLAPFILHDGAKHERDGESYSQPARDILRGGGGLEIL